MSLPWDRFQPEKPVEVPYEPEPELPYTPPNLPQRQRDIDFASILKDAFAQALQESGPALKDQALDYARETIGATVRGEQVDHEHPTITATDHTGKQLVIADARNRSWRTFLQGLMFDVLAAIVAVIATLTGADLWQKETWIAFGILLLKSVVSAVFSYLMRLRVAPTIKTRGPEMMVLPVVAPIPQRAA